MVGIMSLERLQSDLEFLYEIQSILDDYEDIEINLDELPSNDSIYWLNEFELD